MVNWPSGAALRAVGVVGSLWLGVSLTTFMACGSAPSSPEDEIRAVFRRAEIAIEAKDVKVVKNMISDDYRDQRGRDKDALRGVLAGHLLRNRDIHLFTRVAEIELGEDGRAHALIFVAMTGVPVQQPEALLAMKGHFYRVELDLVTDGGDWYVISANERPATASDLR
jgi:hypothetical protein